MVPRHIESPLPHLSLMITSLNIVSGTIAPHAACVRASDVQHEGWRRALEVESVRHQGGEAAVRRPPVDRRRDVAVGYWTFSTSGNLHVLSKKTFSGP
jgi:hypothetical protein